MHTSLIKYLSFIIACFIVVGVFVTSTTFIQLAVGILIYPLLVLFAYKLFARKIRNYSPRKASTIKPPRVSIEKTEQSERSSVGIADIDKRVFLKLIGGTGITLFLMSLFSKKVESLIPSTYPGMSVVSIRDETGNKINPAQSSPLDGYNIAEIEDSTISFYGFTNKNGFWYILRVDTVTGSFRYARGDSNFPRGWNNRETLEYDYYNDIFKN